jgi:tetratricopeptide (TPR) repeat protein
MTYTAKKVAQLLGLSVRQINAWVRAGFLSPARGPDGAPLFSFQDVVLLRTAKGLMSARIAPSRVRRALARLKRQLPEGRPLTGVAIAAEGNRIVVRDGGARWNPESGQALFDFEVAELARSAGEIARLDRPPTTEAAPSDEPGAADSLYEEGYAREDSGDVDGAIEAYREALAVDGEHIDALVNLGRLLHERGDAASAVRLYERALAIRADATAAFNLGVALEDLERLREAAAAYESAVAADPRAADAHYNLAGVYERLGENAAALRHLRAYKQLTQK